jgi:hypothetical protein
MSKTMSLILLGAVLFLCSAVVVPAQGPTPEVAQKVVDAAVLKAKAENKVVFVHYSASW